MSLVPPRMAGIKADHIGSATALAGAALLASNFDFAQLGWLLFLASNVAWIVYGLKTHQRPLVVMQLGFTGTSFLGIFNNLLG